MGEWKIFSFPSFVFGWRVEKWDDGKLFCLIREKKGRMENIIYVN